ncbi:hypothetical protein N0V82_009689 [Gnomoniopsis sp. IMI 355080]|nr:hypothetical protein N0V82_009689 [Gnomoniopsis sp. IMI 355080]
MGGANPAIRTLFYRLVRLLSLTISPIFVFDGPNKPAFKRGKRSRGPGDTVSVAMAKRLFKLFGYAIHDAPGEAEAECALLQQQGVVDAVLSEDVDTIMFGCTRTLRNWSAEGTRAAKTPTHVSVYDVDELKQGETGLDREGMVLVALMSGGDYIPEGVPGCGVKVACEAAKAGFGKRLCRIKRSDTGALQQWREELMRELRTNESKFFRVKHKALTIPEDFPDVEVLRYYTHPVVSQPSTVERLRRDFPSKKEIDIAGLREFTAETFDWTFKIGAIKFIKVFAQGLLVQGLMDLSRQDVESDDPGIREQVESKLVKSIKMTRVHFSTDATPELRMSFIPIDIVGVDLDAEEDEVASTYGRSGLALNSDDEGDDQLEDEDGQYKNGPRKVYDPHQPDLAWIPETVAKLGVPLLVEDWEARQRNKQLAKAKGPARRSRKKASDMPVGALDKYVRSTKPSSIAPPKDAEMAAIPLSNSQPASQQVRTKRPTSTTRDTLRGVLEPTRRKQSDTSKTKGIAPPSRPSFEVNPWSIASSQTTPKAFRTKPNIEDRGPPDAIFISSSPDAPSPPPTTAPAADNSHERAYQSSVLLPTDDNPRRLSSFDDLFSLASNPVPTKSSADTTRSPRKHDRNSSETAKPAAKRTQRSKVARENSPTRRAPNRAGRAAHQTSQPSIKSFGKVSEAMCKNVDAVPALGKASGPIFDAGSDSDSGLEDLSSFLGRQFSKTAQRLQPASGQSTPIPILSQNSTDVPKLKTTHSLPIEIPSSPTPPPLPPNAAAAVAVSPSPSPFTSASKMTRVYISRTSDAGLGYFREVQVTRDEADRMMRDELESSRRATKRHGGRRMWRESEVSMIDLTGDD